MSGTLAGQPLSLIVHRRRSRAEGTLGPDRLTVAWDIGVQYATPTVELSGNLGGLPMSLRAELDLEADPDSHQGRALSRCSIEGQLAGSFVQLDHMPHVGTFGAGRAELSESRGLSAPRSSRCWRRPTVSGRLSRVSGSAAAGRVRISTCTGTCCRGRLTSTGPTTALRTSCFLSSWPASTS